LRYPIIFSLEAPPAAACLPSWGWGCQSRWPCDCHLATCAAVVGRGSSQLQQGTGSALISAANPRLVGACERQARGFWGARCAAWPVVKAPPCSESPLMPDATCTSLENACCLHGFEGAKMEQGQGECRIMAHIGCRCPPHQQDLFLERVRGFKAQGPRGAG
jgi:hypothetical protein